MKNLLGNRIRVAVTALTLSAGGLIGLVAREGYRDDAYIPVPGDVPTLGFGSTTHEDGRPVKLGDKTDPVRALKRKQRDLVRFESALKNCVKVPLHQWEFDSYMDLLYNIGEGREGVADGFCWLKSGGNSTLVRRLNAGDYEGACDAILMWKIFTNKQTGERYDCSMPENSRICGGLWTRRLETHAHCKGVQ